MVKNKKPMGRPTTRIDTAVLIALRSETGLSQEELAEKVYALAKKPWSTRAVLKTTGQRWEAKGTMAASLAAHLAAVLDTTLPVLKGEVPAPAPDRIAELVAILQIRAEQGSHSELNEALAHYQGLGEEDAVTSLAKEISHEMEVAQLSQAKEDFNRLSLLTGLTKREVCRPISQNGFWLLVASGAYGLARYELLSGSIGIRHEVNEELRTLSQRAGGSDAKVSFSETKPWFTVTWTHPRLNLSRTLRFVRCQASEKGLSWVAATEMDRYWLFELVHEAYPFFNFVTGFDSVQVPSQVVNLRIVFERYPSQQENKESQGLAPFTLLHTWEGLLPHLHQATLESFKADGCSHRIVIDRLAADLWDSLQPELSEWPLDYWSLRVAECRIDVMLDVPLRVAAGCAKWPDMGCRFCLSLAEVTSDGMLRSAPWNAESVKDVYDRLTSSLRDAQAQARQAPSAG